MVFSGPFGPAGTKGLFLRAACRTQNVEEKNCVFLCRISAVGGDAAKQGTEILNICLLNTCSIPGHILGSGERAVNKMGKSLPWGESGIGT